MIRDIISLRIEPSRRCRVKRLAVRKATPIDRSKVPGIVGLSPSWFTEQDRVECAASSEPDRESYRGRSFTSGGARHGAVLAAVGTRDVEGRVRRLSDRSRTYICARPKCQDCNGDRRAVDSSMRAHVVTSEALGPGWTPPNWTARKAILTSKRGALPRRMAHVPAPERPMRAQTLALSSCS